ncbi:MAG TPA: hypothetical protein PLN93_10480 [Vicinamibacterales bacterium]|nr:hypothetical protein [Vicinamibacterales bacterium]HOQ61208.1 hypothetical protein [Vicinamibacterales bacterium]HPK72355.1 hypothetical protein [Vicinamibacterales bacterium]
MTRYYEVIGAAPVVLDGRSVAPGVITTAELDAALEAFLLRLGALRIVDPATESELILPARHRPAQQTLAAPPDDRPAVAVQAAEE